MLTDIWKSSVRQKTKDLDVLLGQAQMAFSLAGKFGNELSDLLGLDPVTSYIEGELKDPDRIRQKADNKYGGDLSRVCDIARSRILFDSPDQIHKFRKIVKGGQNSHPFLKTWQGRVEIINKSLGDYYERPKFGGYVGINMNLKVNLGGNRYHICEMQLMHKEMQPTDKESHKLYEQMREITDFAEAEQRNLTYEEGAMVSSLQRTNIELYYYDINRLGLWPLLPETGHVHAELREQDLQNTSSPASIVTAVAPPRHSL